jgi:hypothetical protein
MKIEELSGGTDPPFQAATSSKSQVTPIGDWFVTYVTPGWAAAVFVKAKRKRLTAPKEANERIECSGRLLLSKRFVKCIMVVIVKESNLRQTSEFLK